MKLRAILFVVLEVAAVGALPAACGGGAAGKLQVDTPVLPYKSPDIDDITGTDSFDTMDSGSDAGSAATTPATVPGAQPASAPAAKPAPKAK